MLTNSFSQNIDGAVQPHTLIQYNAFKNSMLLIVRNVQKNRLAMMINGLPFWKKVTNPTIYQMSSPPDKESMNL